MSEIEFDDTFNLWAETQKAEGQFPLDLKEVSLATMEVYWMIVHLAFVYEYYKQNDQAVKLVSAGEILLDLVKEHREGASDAE
jgi:hypothetical protein